MLRFEIRKSTEESPMHTQKMASSSMEITRNLIKKKDRLKTYLGEESKTLCLMNGMWQER